MTNPSNGAVCLFRHSLLIRHSSSVIRGHDTSRPSFSRNRPDRVPVFIGRSRRCIGLHRDDDAVRNSTNGHSSDGACAQHSGRFHWHVPVLARRILFVEIILAVRIAFHSGCVLGGYLQPSASLLRILIGIVLLFSAARLFFRRSDPPQTFPPSRPRAISVGAGLGFLAGLTGTGGGIFLTPLLLFCRWAHIRQAAAVSALFIWVNSIAGLVGYFTKVHSIPSLGLILAAAAIIGGIIGSHLGSRHFAVRGISLFLATVLLIAGMKLIFTG